MCTNAASDPWSSIRTTGAMLGAVDWAWAPTERNDSASRPTFDATIFFIKRTLTASGGPVVERL
jgi:hypothetical protein